MRPTPSTHPTSQESPPQQILLQRDAQGLTRLAALEAYAAADERVRAMGASWAAYAQDDAAGAVWRGQPLHLVIRRPGSSAVLTPTAAVTGLWWAPDGQQLLVAQRRGAGQD